MSGVEIEYLLGLFFAISATRIEAGKLKAETIQLIAGVVLVIMAFMHFSLIH